MTPIRSHAPGIRKYQALTLATLVSSLCLSNVEPSRGEVVSIVADPPTNCLANADLSGGELMSSAEGVPTITLSANNTTFSDSALYGETRWYGTTFTGTWYYYGYPTSKGFTIITASDGSPLSASIGIASNGGDSTPVMTINCEDPEYVGGNVMGIQADNQYHCIDSSGWYATEQVVVTWDNTGYYPTVPYETVTAGSDGHVYPLLSCGDGCNYWPDTVGCDPTVLSTSFVGYLISIADQTQYIGPDEATVASSTCTFSAQHTIYGFIASWRGPGLPTGTLTAYSVNAETGLGCNGNPISF
jgi:hypothetical protein